MMWRFTLHLQDVKQGTMAPPTDDEDDDFDSPNTVPSPSTEKEDPDLLNEETNNGTTLFQPPHTAAATTAPHLLLLLPLYHQGLVATQQALPMATSNSKNTRRWATNILAISKGWGSYPGTTSSASVFQSRPFMVSSLPN